MLIHVIYHSRKGLSIYDDIIKNKLVTILVTFLFSSQILSGKQIQQHFCLLLVSIKAFISHVTLQLCNFMLMFLIKSIYFEVFCRVVF